MAIIMKVLADSIGIFYKTFKQFVIAETLSPLCSSTQHCVTIFRIDGNDIRSFHTIVSMRRKYGSLIFGWRIYSWRKCLLINMPKADLGFSFFFLHKM